MQRPDVEDPDFYLSDDEDDPMNEVFCVECGRGDDEHSLLLCDGKPCILWSPSLHAPAYSVLCCEYESITPGLQ